MERILYEEQKLGGIGQFVTGIDEFKASSNAATVALSAHTILTSAGVTVIAVGQSNVVKLRMENAQFYNQNAGWVTVELRDGLPTGQLLLGPINVNPSQERLFGRDDLMGRAAYSSIILIVVSGAVSPPVSNGVRVNVGFVAENYQL